jgi:hypothetical protein
MRSVFHKKYYLRKSNLAQRSPQFLKEDVMSIHKGSSKQSSKLIVISYLLQLLFVTAAFATDEIPIYFPMGEHRFGKYVNYWMEQIVLASGHSIIESSCGRKYFYIPAETQIFRWGILGASGEKFNLHSSSVPHLAQNGASTFFTINQSNAAVDWDNFQRTTPGAQKLSGCLKNDLDPSTHAIILDPEICARNDLIRPVENMPGFRTITEVLNLTEQEWEDYNKGVKKKVDAFDFLGMQPQRPDPLSTPHVAMDYLVKSYKKHFAPSVVALDRRLSEYMLGQNLPIKMGRACGLNYIPKSNAPTLMDIFGDFSRSVRQTKFRCVSAMANASEALGSVVMQNPAVQPAIEAYQENIRAELEPMDPTGGYIISTVEVGGAVYGTTMAVTTPFGGVGATYYTGKALGSAIAAQPAVAATAQGAANVALLAAPAVVSAGMQSEYSHARYVHALSSEDCSDLATAFYHGEMRRCAGVLECHAAARKKYKLELEKCEAEFGSGDSWLLF